MCSSPKCAQVRWETTKEELVTGGVTPEDADEVLKFRRMVAAMAKPAGLLSPAALREMADYIEGK